MNVVTKRTEWHDLIQHQDHLAKAHMREWFEADSNRFSKFSLQANGIFLDYSRNRIDDTTLSLLCNLAKAVGLPARIKHLFSGQPVNTTEKRPALHMALRDPNYTPILVNNDNIAEMIRSMQAKMREFTQNIHEGKWKGATGKTITDVVNIGIGGSYLGPMMCTHALKDFAVSALQFHYISTVDNAHLYDVLETINPETTLFIISSKSFTTIETLTNARTIISHLQSKFTHTNFMQQHVIAITAAKQKALDFGVTEENIFPLWDWVGGRYSIWSAIGLPLMLMIGAEQFAEFLQGGYEMDVHFQQAEFKQNIPVILGLLDIWYMNFFNAKVQAIIPYSHRLRYFIPFIQQAEMESNGKSMTIDGESVNYTTSPVIFGEEGCNGQHTYHQLLHQGPHLIPVDFILVGRANRHDHHQDILMASALSQAQALMRGKSHAEIYQELLQANYSASDADLLAKHKMTEGNRPSNLLFLESLTPHHLGALIALYEHKVFVQGAIWDINSFDQWGVELGKQLLPDILQKIQGSESHKTLDSATTGMINKYLLS